MKKCIVYLSMVLSFLLSGCSEDVSEDSIRFALSAEYPPFEYHKNGELKGFDVDLARLLAKELGKKAVFEDMQFSSVLPSLSVGNVDAAISTITITETRKQSFDFSLPYYKESLVAVFSKNNPFTKKENLTSAKIACQLGTTMEIWIKRHLPNAQVVTMDNNNQAIEALKNGHVDAVLIDMAQGVIFSQKNSGLGCSLIAQSDSGYAVAFKKNSSLKTKVDKALDKLIKEGKVTELQEKWLGGAKCKS